VRSSGFALLSCLAVACASPSASTGEDPAGSTTDAGTHDAGATEQPPDAGSPLGDAGTDAGVDAGSDIWATEVEPNGEGAGSVPTPIASGERRIAGVIGTPNDADIFTLTLQAGQLLRWSLDPVDGPLCPRLTIFNAGATAPTRVVESGCGKPAVIEQWVLKSGAYYLAVEDARNATTPSGIGGPAYAYRLSAVTFAPPAARTLVPSKLSGVLGSAGALAMFRVGSDTAWKFTAEVFADRKATPSSLDAMISLWDLSRGVWVATNADGSLSTADPKLSFDGPAGEYLVLVHNELPTGADLSYEMDLRTP
jgi:hypothetical protein